MARENAQGPQFVRYFDPVLESLKKLGGSGRPSEVRDEIVLMLDISEEEQSVMNESGQSRLYNQVAWARFYLVKAGYIDASVRGVWSLTEKGRNSRLTQEDALNIFRDVQQQFGADGEEASNIDEPQGPIEDEKNLAAPDDEDHRAALLSVLRDLPPEGFERLCQRLLRESGFERVTVTGRSGDGGIDGIGLLLMNPFVSFKVLFQCKRYSGTVNVSQVRDFRGAMMGRADKGIIITTGSFTSGAKEEAVRDGVPPIELVDSEKLIDMFEELELGLQPKKAYDVDLAFFKDYS